MLFTLAWRNLWRNRRRTLITTASIFFAVLLAVCLRALQEGVYGKMIENVVGFYTGYVQIHQTGYWEEQSLENTFPLQAATASEIEALPQVEAVVPRLESFALASSDAQTKGCMVVGIDPEKEDQLTQLKQKLSQGSYLQDAQQAVLIAEGLAKSLQVQTGDTLVLLGSGYRGVSAAGKYEIAGLVNFGSPDLNKRLVYLPLETAQELYGAYGLLSAYALKLRSARNLPALQSQIRDQVGEAYEVMTWPEMMPELVQTIEADKGGGVLTLWVLYMIIGFGILGTLLMMLAERKYEFGVLVAIGMKRHKLSRILMLENLLLSFLGVLAGSLVALPIVLYFNRYPIFMGEEMSKVYEQYGMEAVLPMAVEPSIFVSEGLTILVLTFLLSLYTLWAVARIHPVKAMRV